MATAILERPVKPYPDFPLFPHSNGQWAKKIKGKMQYFGAWDDPQGALARLEKLLKSGRRHTKKNVEKPDPPYDDFPLFAHPNGQWAKKVNSKCYYFGPWKDPEAALGLWLKQKDDLLSGRQPSVCRSPDAVTLKYLCNKFLATKKSLWQSGELSIHTVNRYRKECERIMKVFGAQQAIAELGPSDFERLREEFAKTLGPTSLFTSIEHARVLFKYAFDQGIISTPVKYGQSFKRPSAKTLRIDRNKKPKKMLSAEEIRFALERAGTTLRAMILLGINCGMGNHDCATLEIAALDLKRGWFNWPRPKTGIDRFGPLWPETCAALEKALAERTRPVEADNERYVFITSQGRTFFKFTSDDPISKSMRKLLKSIRADRKGVGFYALRHTFSTVAEGCNDQKAVEFIMGHIPAVTDMSARYREEFTEERLRRVTDYVHQWLFGKKSSST